MSKLKCSTVSRDYIEGLVHTLVSNVFWEKKKCSQNCQRTFSGISLQSWIRMTVKSIHSSRCKHIFIASCTHLQVANVHLNPWLSIQKKSLNDLSLLRIISCSWFLYWLPHLLNGLNSGLVEWQVCAESLNIPYAVWLYQALSFDSIAATTINDAGDCSLLTGSREKFVPVWVLFFWS